MATIIRAFDWASTPLGPADQWPQALKTLAGLMLTSRQPMFIGWGAERTWLYNDAFAPILGHKHPAALGRPSMEVWAEAREVLEPLFQRVFAGEPVSIPDFSLPLDRGGIIQTAHFEFAYTPARGDDGSVDGLFGACIETTARVQAEQRQAAESERQRRLFQCAPGFIAILKGPEHVFEFVNEAYVRLTGEREFIGRPVRDVLPEIAGQGFFELLDGVYTTGKRFVADQILATLARTPGSPREDRRLDFVYEPILDENNQVSGIFVEGFDVTETFKAHEKLRELNDTLEHRVEERTQELQAAQEALSQAQKVEALGQLTGGIAHDFNNMLAVILGALALLERRLKRGDTNIAEYVASATEGAQRAAKLTQRLLAFARQQPLMPTVVNVNGLLKSMEDMLRRSLPETTQIEMVMGGGIWKIHIDASQLESAILNLAINAHDAMAHGGKLTIETENSSLNEAYALDNPEVLPGQYVQISVTDTGTGMSPEVAKRVFEPFFTTKSVGKGTGLGLSQVHGFVKQSKGHLKIYSELGCGTTLKIYLPRYYEQGVSANLDATDHAALPQGHLDDVILVVDDEPRINAITVDTLRELGYTVMHATSGAEALGIIRSNPQITLLFTDVVMPEMTGRVLADHAVAILPELKVLYTTGYTRNAIVHNGTLDPGLHLIQKPFTMDQVARKLKEVLS